MSESKRRTVVGMMLAVLLCFDLYYFKHFDKDSEKQPANLAEILEAKNETYFRNENTNEWTPTQDAQVLQVGDLLSTGPESYLQLKLQNGEGLAVAEKSRMSFTETKQEKYPDLSQGRFTITFDGTMKVAIQGQLAIFEGRDAEVQITLDRNQAPQFQLNQGYAQIRQGTGKPLHLITRIPTDLPVAASALHGIPQTTAKKAFLLYNWRLYDLYEQKDFQLFERKEKADTFQIVTKLKWSGPPETSYKVQVWAGENILASRTFSTNETSYTTQTAALGLNQWRVSADGKNWSAPAKFEVVPEFLKNAEPEISVSTHELTLRKLEVQAVVKLSAPFKALGYVAQASTDMAFSPQATRTFWSSEAELHLSFFKAGTYFYRFRSVNSQQQLSEWSRAEKFKVEESTGLTLPKLASHKKTPRKNQALQKKEAVTETRSLANVDNPVESSNSIQLSAVRPARPNDKYQESKISFRGLLWTIQSSQQFYSQQNAPVATGFGLDGIHWWGSHGLDARFKLGVFGANREGSQTSMKDLEALYHYRFTTGLPLNYVRELQLSVFGGYEIYRNVGNSFSNHYDLIKFGTSLEFPWADNWGLGGELAYGMGTNGDSKQEISGHFNYFLNKNWSLGAGYRLNFFTAGSAASSPGGIFPYREGYTEGFSTLDYHF